MTAQVPVTTIWVIVPALNEASAILGTLDALVRQRDRELCVVVVDNGSTDGTPELVRDFAVFHPRFDFRLIIEPQKGTGAAADTGMRYAISNGAELLARTDADCLPAPQWLSSLRSGFDDGLSLIAGPLIPRHDEGLSGWHRMVLRWAVTLASVFGKLRSGNRGPHYLGPYMMTAGCNMAITSELYLAAGGFPRSAIEDVHEDRALVNAVRLVSSEYGTRSGAVVFGSSRRVLAWGLRRTLAWYADHRYRPEVVDIR